MLGDLQTRIEKPLGREQEIDVIIDVVTDQGTCYVSGEAGVGKSLILREVRRLLERSGADVLIVSGMEATAIVPLAPLLRLCPPGASDPGAAIIAELYRRSQRANVVVLVDDAHLLDEATAAIVRQLASTDVVGIVVAHRTGENVPASIESILAEGVGEHIPVEPLDRLTTDALTLQLLGGEPDTASLDWIWRQSRGNPLYTRELISAALQTGALHQEGSKWTLDRSIRVWSARLNTLVSKRLANLDPGERQALHYLAVGGRLPLGLVQDLTSAQTMGVLEGRELVRIESGEVEIAHPLYGTAISATMSAEQMNTARTRLAESMLASAEHHDPVAIGRLLLDAGAEMDSSLLRSAIENASGYHLHQHAERFARELLKLERTPETLMTLCATLSAQRRWREAEDSFNEAVQRAAENEVPALHEQWALLNFEFRTDLEPAVRIAQETEEVLVNGGSDLWQVTRLRFALFLDNLDISMDENRQWLEKNPDSPLADLVRLHVTTAASHNGRFDVGIAATEEYSGSIGDPVEMARMDAVVIQCRAWTAGMQEARPLIEALHQYSVSPGDPDVEALAHIYEGMVNSDLTNTSKAVGPLRRAEHVARYSARRRQTGLLVGESARALAFSPDGPHEARYWLDQMNQLSQDGLWIGIPVASLAEGVLAYRSGRDPSPHLRRGLDHSRRRSARIHEVALLRMSVHVGDRQEAITRLEELVGVMGGGFAELVAREARSLQRGDAVALDQLAVDAWRFGALGLAADASTLAAAIHTEAHDSRSALISQLRSEHLRQLEPSWSVAQTRTVPVLSDRETEVVQMVAAGSSNKAIADELFISHRTVESHLRRVYNRTGVGGREELVDLVKRATTPPRNSTERRST